jgi:hypothetical protein
MIAPQDVAWEGLYTIAPLAPGVAKHPVEGDDVRADRDSWPAPPDQAAYYGLAGELVRAVQDVTEADPVGLLATILTIFGVSAGPSCAIYQGSRQRPNLYMCLVGDSGSGRKGTAWSVAREPFDQAYPEHRQLHVPGLGSGEGLIARLRPRSDRTAEPRALVLEQEFARLLTAMAREGSTLSQVLRNGWEGEAMGHFLARESDLILDHHIGAMAHITPLELRDKLRDTDAASGFGNRFLWLAVRQTRLRPFPGNPAPLVARYAAPLRRAIVEAQSPRELELTADAKDRWEMLYAELNMRRRLGLAGALTARAEAQIVRLALVHALLDRSRDVGLDHLEAAIALEAFAERSVVHIFGDSTGNPDANEIRRRLRDCYGMTRNELRAECGIHEGARMSRALDLLESLGLVAITKQPASPKGGPRPWFIRSSE